mgnify:CR=1 FL=1
MVNSQNDEVTQDQQSLDEEQGEIPATPQYATSDQLTNIHNELQQLRSENRGLQGLVDNGLNGIRRDTQTWAEQQFSGMRNEMDKKAYLENLDEEQRAVVTPLLNEMEELRKQNVQQAQPQQSQTQQQAAPDQAQQQWEQIYKFVESMGLDRNDPNLLYSALDPTNSLAPEQRSAQFAESVGNAVRAKGGTPPQQPSPQQPQVQKPATVSPPVDQPSGKAAPSYKNLDDVRSAYIEGKIEKAEYQSMVQKLQ